VIDQDQKATGAQVHHGTVQPARTESQHGIKAKNPKIKDRISFFFFLSRRLNRLLPSLWFFLIHFKSTKKLHETSPSLFRFENKLTIIMNTNQS
jgi:hypothetical protein